VRVALVHGPGDFRNARVRRESRRVVGRVHFLRNAGGYAAVQRLQPAGFVSEHPHEAAAGAGGRGGGVGLLVHPPQAAGTDPPTARVPRPGTFTLLPGNYIVRSVGCNAGLILLRLPTHPPPCVWCSSSRRAA
jgi:hypothetical protein